MQNITLIGMPGSGKSTVGQALAKKLDWGYIDTDTLIVERHGKIQTILDEQGPATFRKIEEQLLLSLLETQKTIISPGGSVIYSPASMAHLKSLSTVIFLNVPLVVIQKRCEAAKRGIVGLKEKGWDVLYAERTALYKKYADLEIIPQGGPPSADAEQILPLLSIN